MITLVAIFGQSKHLCIFLLIEIVMSSKYIIDVEYGIDKYLHYNYFSGGDSIKTCSGGQKTSTCSITTLKSTHLTVQ